MKTKSGSRSPSQEAKELGFESIAPHSTAGFHNFGTVDSGGRSLFLAGAVQCTEGCLTASLVPTH